ncbi:MAG: NADH-quinone oxidoreductase subunit J [Deltaproteobacteria bacterium]|nr:NADH-quinone oxidoreductase subunit J [Deltaproteobacteria bacterium]
MTYIFLLLALVMVASALAVVTLHNPLHSALALILNLLTVAALFAALDAHFLAAVQIIVYAGAIMVLVVFLLMLLNIKTEKPKPMGKFLFVLSAAVGVSFLALCIPAFNEAFRIFPDPVHELEGTVKAMGRILYTEYVFPFEAASVLILAAIVGAVMLAKRSYSKGSGHGSN